MLMDFGKNKLKKAGFKRGASPPPRYGRTLKNTIKKGHYFRNGS